MSNNPLVSVLVNNYNYGQYLEDCILSVLNQTYRNFELIVYDDQSTDNSVEICKKYSNNITLLEGKGQKYKANAFNQANAIFEAFKTSKGEIICLLDSDDMFRTNKLAEVVYAFKDTSDLVLVQDQMLVLSNDSSENNKLKAKIFKKDNLLNYIYKTNNILGLYSQTSGLSFRRNYLEKVLPIKEDEYYLIWPDVRLTRQSVFYGSIFTFTSPLTFYRKHDENDSNKLVNTSFSRSVLEQMYNYYNDKAIENGYKTIDLKKSIHRFDKNKYELFIYKLFSKENLSWKASYIKTIIMKLIVKYLIK